MHFFPIFHKSPTYAQVTAPALLHCECGCGTVFPRPLLCVRQTGSAVAPLEYLYMLHAYALYGVPKMQAAPEKVTVAEDMPTLSCEMAHPCPDLLLITRTAFRF